MRIPGGDLATDTVTNPSIVRGARPGEQGSQGSSVLLRCQKFHQWKPSSARGFSSMLDGECRVAEAVELLAPQRCMGLTWFRRGQDAQCSMPVAGRP